MTNSCFAYVDGCWRSDAGGERLPVHSPVDEGLIAEIVVADTAMVDAAVESARAAFARGEWRNATVAERQRVLRRIAALIRERVDDIAARECANTGVPIRQVRDRHVMRAALNFEFFADYIGQADDRVFEQEAPFINIVRRDPVGVAALIAPWNAPIALATMQMAAALAFGNSIVVKPSELTPLEFEPLMDLLTDAGVPRGVVNLVNGPGPVTGDALIRHEGVDVVSFIGGTRTGRHIGGVAGGNLKAHVLELGGKSANIVTADCDLDRALDAALVGIFSNNGQQCLAGARILVEEGIAERFIGAFAARAARLRIGDPRQEDTEIGPLISRAQYERVLSYAEGVDVRHGGRRAPGFDKGWFVEPTVAVAGDNRAPVCQDEIFGPFATFLSFRDIDHAIEIANDSEFGLVGYLWSDDLPTIVKVSNEVRTGTLWVNTPMTRDLRVPFGGYKNSGVGRIGGDDCRQLFTEQKVLTLPLGDFPIAKLGQG